MGLKQRLAEARQARQTPRQYTEYIPICQDRSVAPLRQHLFGHGVDVRYVPPFWPFGRALLMAEGDFEITVFSVPLERGPRALPGLELDRAKAARSCKPQPSVSLPNFSA